jgi:hypothetical protein
MACLDAEPKRSPTMKVKSLTAHGWQRRKLAPIFSVKVRQENPYNLFL